MKKKIWVDFTNTPHVHFLIPIMLYFKESFTYYVTVRDFSETVSLLKYYGIDAKVIGSWYPVTCCSKCTIESCSTISN